jgi:2-C-methyl-D-erythritol 4-phosphate cytidylyltransferase
LKFNVKQLSRLKPEIVYLTLEEFRILENTEEKNSTLKNAFLFACLTALRIGDLNKLTWGEIVDDKVGGILAIPALDTVKRVDKKQQIIRTEKRDEIWLAQTPQMFRFDLLNKALTSFKGNPTDESEAIEAFGLSPKIVKGSLVNFKITYPDDLMRVEKLIQGSNHD